MIQMIEPTSAARSSRIRMIPAGEVTNAVSAPDRDVGAVVVSAGVGVGLGVGVGEAVGDAVGVGEGVRRCSTRRS